MHDQFAAVPADAEFFDHGIRFFQTEPDHGGVHGLLDKLFERKVQAADGGLRVGGFEAGGIRRDRVLVAIVKLNFRGEFVQSLDDAGGGIRFSCRNITTDLSSEAILRRRMNTA